MMTVIVVSDLPRWQKTQHSPAKEANVHINEVIEGLQNGKKFVLRTRTENGNPCVDRVRRAKNFSTVVEVVHSCMIDLGEENGGCGGVAVLSIDVLKNGRWEEEGWEVDTD